MEKELEGRSKVEIAAELEANRAAFFPALKTAGDYWSGRVYAARARSRTRELFDTVSYKARNAAATTTNKVRQNVYKATGLTLLAGAAAGILLRRKLR